MLSRIRHVAGGIESVEGVAETLSASDANTIAYEPTINFDPEFFERIPEMASFGQLSAIPGKRPGSQTMRINVKGSGSAGTLPDWIKYMRACGFETNSLYTLTVGTISGGPFVHGETITGGSSGATGRVVIDTADGTTTLYYEPLTGTFQAETVTGGTSSASASSDGAGTEVGDVAKLITESIPSITLDGYEGASSGIKKELKGSRGKMSFNFRTGEPVQMPFEYMGVENGISDAAHVSGDNLETTVPPSFLSATVSVDDVALKISQLDLNIDTVLGPRQDPSESRGILSFLITDRVITGQADPEMLLAATHDFHSKWFAGTEMALNIEWGSTAGNKFRLWAKRLQYRAIQDGDRDGIKIANTQFQLNKSTTGNDEFVLLIL